MVYGWIKLEVVDWFLFLLVSNHLSINLWTGACFDNGTSFLTMYNCVFCDLNLIFVYVCLLLCSYRCLVWVLISCQSCCLFVRILASIFIISWYVNISLIWYFLSDIGLIVNFSISIVYFVRVRSFLAVFICSMTVFFFPLFSFVENNSFWFVCSWRVFLLWLLVSGQMMATCSWKRLHSFANCFQLVKFGVSLNPILLHIFISWWFTN